MKETDKNLSKEGKMSRSMEKFLERELSNARSYDLRAEARRVVATGVCPKCGTKLKRNSALAGWWQCGAYGEEQFRRPEDVGKPKCSFQCFTE